MIQNHIFADLAPRSIDPNLSPEEREAFDIPRDISELTKKVLTEQFTGHTVTALNNWIDRLALFLPTSYLELKNAKMTEVGLLEVFKYQVRCCKEVPLRDEQTGKIQRDALGRAILTQNPLANNDAVFGWKIYQKEVEARWIVYNAKSLTVSSPSNELASQPQTEDMIETPEIIEAKLVLLDTTLAQEQGFAFGNLLRQVYK